MNSKSGFVIRIVAGIYLIYLGVSVFWQAYQVRPSDFAFKIFISIVFFAVGALYAFRNIKAAYKMTKEESAELPEETVTDETQPLFDKPQHDMTLFRTAPMPTAEELQQGMVTKETDLHANFQSELEEEADEIENDYEEK